MIVARRKSALDSKVTRSMSEIRNYQIDCRNAEKKRSKEIKRTCTKILNEILTTG